MSKLESLSERLNTIVKHTSGILTAGISVLVFLEVLFRYVLDQPLDWSEEMSTFAFAWMCLLGASVGLRYDEHPRLDIFFSRFPRTVQKVARIIINFAIIFMLVVLLIYGYKLTVMMRMQRTAALGYSISFVYAVLPVSAFIMLVHMVAQTAVLITKIHNKD